MHHTTGYSNEIMFTYGIYIIFLQNTYFVLKVLKIQELLPLS